MGFGLLKALFWLSVFVALIAMIRCARADVAPFQPIGVMGWNPTLPVAGPGPMFNFAEGDQAITNALAHIGWSLAIPMLGEKIGGTKGKWIAGATWITASLLQEWLVHAPKNPGPGYPSEVRTDLVTRIVPTLCVLAF